MPGMNQRTGRWLEGRAHIEQSVADILTTPLGSRVMRREYGSLLPYLIDQPLHDATLLRAYSATAMAVARWEPRIRARRITRSVDAANPGAATIRIEGETENGAPVDLAVQLGVPTA